MLRYGVVSANAAGQSSYARDSSGSELQSPMLDRKTLLLLAVIGLSATTAQGQICRKLYDADPEAYGASQVDIAFGWLAVNPNVTEVILETNGHIVNYNLGPFNAGVFTDTGYKSIPEQMRSLPSIRCAGRVS